MPPSPFAPPPPSASVPLPHPRGALLFPPTTPLTLSLAFLATAQTGKNRSSGDDAIRVEVKGPTADGIVATVVDFSNGRYEIAYVPPVAGDYTVAVMLDENAFDADDSYNHIRGSPFEVRPSTATATTAVTTVTTIIIRPPLPTPPKLLRPSLSLPPSVFPRLPSSPLSADAPPLTPTLTPLHAPAVCPRRHDRSSARKAGRTCRR